MNLDLNKDNYLLTSINTNNKIEEEQKETLGNLSPNKKLKKTKILNLEIITSSFITNGTIIKLTPEGYSHGLRNAHDGITYFGFEELENNNENVSLSNILYFNFSIT